jgi:WD40 repeat protein
MMIRPLLRAALLIFPLMLVLVCGGVLAGGAQARNVVAYIANMGIRWDFNLIYLLDVGRRLNLPVTPNLDAYSELEWSPDGRMLAFTADYTSYRRVYVWENYAISRSYRISGYYNSLLWSPDGDQLLFYANPSEKENSYQGYSLSIETGAFVRAENLGYQAREIARQLYTPFGEHFSPDERWKLQFSDESYHLIDVSTGETHARFDSMRHTTWSRDGRWLAFLDFRSQLRLVEPGRGEWMLPGRIGIVEWQPR